MARGRKLLPPDPRPSRAHPEHRAIRKQLEKEHGYGWVPPVILGLVGLTLAFDVTKDVEKAEERHKQREAEEEERKRRRKEAGRGRPRRQKDDGDDDHDHGEDRDGDRSGRDGDGGRGERRDGWLYKEDRLERGEGGPWDRERERERERRKGGGYDGYDNYYDDDDDEDDRRYSRRGSDDGYDFGYDRGRRALDDRRSRPRARRRSSDW
ncbi:hypothetical protein VM1G_04496 [Cytospora mali]|uniref:Uncharacterized protein n=1 Tax=Cytospora mali TaxID=578113 RepID=A0A194VWA6_CYTMA|nr:hypothetical protein VM1G_04496 [Valsa mali]